MKTLKRFGNRIVKTVTSNWRVIRLVALVLLMVGIVLSIAGQATVTAYAQGGHESAVGQRLSDGGDGGDGDPPANMGAGKTTILKMFKTLGELFISISYSLMVLLFAVGTVKSGLAAQAAQQFGATGRVSMEFMNLATGVVIFVIGLLSMPIVNWILSQLVGIMGANDMTIQVPAGLGIELP